MSRYTPEQIIDICEKYNANGEDGLSDKRGRHKMDDEVDELERLRRGNARLKRQLPEKEMLAELIKEYDERFNHILGYRRMTSWINHFNHTDYKKKRVHRIMKKLRIHSVIRKKQKKYAVSTPEAVAENKLGQRLLCKCTE